MLGRAATYKMAHLLSGGNNVSWKCLIINRKFKYFKQHWMCVWYNIEPISKLIINFSDDSQVYYQMKTNK